MSMILQKMKQAVILVLVVAMLSGTALASFGAYVLPPKMKVYFAPSTVSEQIGYVCQGDSVVVEAFSGAWARVNYHGYVGFAEIKDLVRHEPIPAKLICDSQFLYITRTDWTPRMGMLGKGIVVYQRGIKDGYVLISDRGFNVLGYVPAANLK